MIDNIAFNYISTDDEHLLDICKKMRDHDKGSTPFHLTSTTESNPLFPMRVKYLPTNRVLVSGSLHKFWNKDDHCNDNDFSIKDAFVSLLEVCDILKIDRKRVDPKITRIELGINIELSGLVEEFLTAVNKYNCHRFSYSKPKNGTVKKWGKELRLTDYDIKLYNKSFLANHELKTKKYIVENLLRLEVAYNSHISRYLKCDTIVGLLSKMSTIPIILQDITAKIELKPKIDYSAVPVEDIFICEGYNNNEFHYNTKDLPRKKKSQLDETYHTFLRRHGDTSLSMEFYSKVEEKIVFLSHV